jgi:hypothetical protein
LERKTEKQDGSWRGCVTNLKKSHSWAPVAQNCTPNYSGGRDQEDCDSKPAWANSLRDPILTNT